MTGAAASRAICRDRLETEIADREAVKHHSLGLAKRRSRGALPWVV